MFPLDINILDKTLRDLDIPDITSATIRQIGKIASHLEGMAKEEIVHLEIGNPGLPAEEIGVKAEIEALNRGIANQYPNIAGIKPLKENGSKFIKAFLNTDIRPEGIVPTVGSMQGSFTLMTLLKMRIPGKDTLLMLFPGFSAQRHQAKLLDFNLEGFDIYDYRGQKLEAKLEEYFKTGRITAMIYSNPNNPAWTNLTEEELEIIGRLATKYDVIVIEDLAYLGMDFRKDFGHPYEAPYIATVSKYTDNYILLISASKIFSYAGQRIALVCMSDTVYQRRYETLKNFFEMPKFGDAYIYGVLYCSSSGTSHSAQFAMAEMLEQAAEGKLNFVEHTRDYELRCEKVKKLLGENGFEIVYKLDGEEPVSDGFFLTAGYGDMTSEELQKELLRYGIATISLTSTGSRQNGVRITVSMLADDHHFDLLNKRLHEFNKDHSQ